MKRWHFLGAVAGAVIAGNNGQADAETIAGISIPSSPYALEAMSIARQALPPEIYLHSLRTFLFAELLGRAWNVSRNTELIFIASILHDTGLAPEFMTKAEHFEVDGANLARTLLRNHSVPTDSVEVVWDAIALHDQGGIARWKKAEVQLVNAGVSADFGAHLANLRREDVIAVLKAAPREQFVPTFLRSAAKMIAAKPTTAAPLWITDVAARMLHGIQFDNFVDEVQTSDPFSRYQ